MLEARRDRDAAYYLANRDAVRARVATYRANNSEKVKQAHRDYYAANREAILADQRTRYASNPSKKIATSRARHASNKDSINADRRAKRKANPHSFRAEDNAKYATSTRVRAKALMNGARTRAKRKGIPFTICRDDVLPRIDAGLCEATGLRLVFGVPHHPRAPSIDRIDSLRGYEPDNIQIVCAQYNMAKGPWGLSALDELSRSIINRGSTT